MNSKIYEFDAVIKSADNGGAYVVFPYDIRAEYGKGRVKVHATFDGEPYDGSIVNMGVKNTDGSVCYITKFDMVESLLTLDHRGKTIFRMSFNPSEIIRRVEIGTSHLDDRIRAINAMADAGYPVGILIAPVILLPDWKHLYSCLLSKLKDGLSPKVKQTGFIDVILMTYSFVQNAINTDAFPNAVPIFDRSLMTGRGRGKYCYRSEVRSDAESFLREEIKQKLNMEILYFA